jgi:hypothetical protein
MSSHSFKRPGLLLVALPALLLFACSKSTTEPVSTSTSTTHLDGLRRPGNDIVVVWPKSEKTTSFNFNVTTECDCPYGTLTCDGSPMGSEILEQSDTRLWAEGESPYSEPASTSSCLLEKGPNADTPGPIYHITPEGSGRTLRMQVRSSATLPDDRAWFTYIEESNSWEAHESASDYFNWSVLSDPVEDCCESH